MAKRAAIYVRRLRRQVYDRQSGAGVARDCTEAGKLSSSTAMRHIAQQKAAMAATPTDPITSLPPPD
jgi:hypothetical protein